MVTLYQPSRDESVSVGVSVRVGVAVAVGVSVGVGVSVAVAVAVSVAVSVGVSVAIDVGVSVDVGVDVDGCVGVSTGVPVAVPVDGAVDVDVPVPVVGSAVSVLGAAAAVAVEVFAGPPASFAVGAAVEVSSGAWERKLQPASGIDRTTRTTRRERRFTVGSLPAERPAGSSAAHEPFASRHEVGSEPFRWSSNPLNISIRIRPPSRSPTECPEPEDDGEAGGTLPSELENDRWPADTIRYVPGGAQADMTWRIVGANFDQMHMNTNLVWAADHPGAEVVGLCDETPETSTGSLEAAAADCDVSSDRCYDDLEDCLRALEPDIVLGGPMNSAHPRFVERVLAHDIHVAIEKPFARSLADADRMLDAAANSDGRLAVNWPVTWSPVHQTLRELLTTDTIGDIVEIQYYGGNAGAPPDDSWFYETESGGGSLLDYLGYGATFATWFRDGELPKAVSAHTHPTGDTDVDRQSVTVCRYETGLSTFQTSLRMPTHPWEHDSTPAKGYEVVGTEGAITTRQHGSPIRVQTSESPDGYVVEPEPLEAPHANLVQYLVHCLEDEISFTGPTAPGFCRSAQRIIETAQRSAATNGEALPLRGDPR